MSPTILGRVDQMIDFDAFIKEQREAKPAAPVIFRIGGKDYPLPSSLPATVALDIVRAKKNLDAKENVDPEVLIEIGDAFFGKENFRTILTENQIGLDLLGDLITAAFNAYKTAQAEPEPVPSEALTAAPSTSS